MTGPGARESEISDVGCVHGIPQRFRCRSELASLPWFGEEGGRLVLSQRKLGPIFDIHTHLAMAHLPGLRIDHMADNGPTLHYLPADAPVDMDRYINQNLRPADLEAVERNLIRGGWLPRGLWRTHTLPNLLREMEEMGIAGAVLMPIDFPFSRNSTAYLKATRGQKAIVPFGSVHPFTPFALRVLDGQIKRGARGIKLHPGTQLAPLSHPRSMALYRACGLRDLPVFFHCGPVGIEKGITRRMSQVALYEPPLAEHPATTFVLGHSGALQVEVALDLADRYPNAWLDLSCQSISKVARILQEADPDRILHGSDWPFYHQAFGIAKVLAVTEGRPALRRKVLWENAQRLLRLGD